MPPINASEHRGGAKKTKKADKHNSSANKRISIVASNITHVMRLQMLAVAEMSRS